MGYKQKSPLLIAEGGTGVTSFTSTSVLIGSGSSALSNTAAPTTGQTLMGSTGANPSFTGSPSVSGTFTAGTGLTSTTGNIVASAGTIKASGLSFDTGTNLLSTFVDKTTFTPSISFGLLSVGVTYGTQTGTWSRIGDMVVFYFDVTLTNKGASVGNALISASGLPTISYPGSVGIYFFDILWSTTAQLYAQIANSGGTFTMALYSVERATGVATQLADTGFLNTSSMQCYGFYLTS